MDYTSRRNSSTIALYDYSMTNFSCRAGNGSDIKVGKGEAIFSFTNLRNPCTPDGLGEGGMDEDF